jgi:hypothetical protein
MDAILAMLLDSLERAIEDGDKARAATALAALRRRMVADRAAFERMMIARGLPR